MTSYISTASVSDSWDTGRKNTGKTARTVYLYHTDSFERIITGIASCDGFPQSASHPRE